MRRIATLGITALTITTSLAPLTANAAGVSTYSQCLNGNNTTVISSNCNLQDIASKLKDAGIDYNGVNFSQAVNSQNCPTTKYIIESTGLNGANAAPSTSTNCPIQNKVAASLPSQNSNATQAQDAVEQAAAEAAKATTQSSQATTTPSSTSTTAPTTTAKTPTTTATTPSTAAPTTTPTKTTESVTAAKNTTTPAATQTDTSEVKTNTNNNVSYAQQVVNLVNIERAKEGLPALTIDTNLEKAATVRAGEIQTKFDHVRPNGLGFSSVLKENGVTYRGAGENIAWGQRTPEEVVTGWMNSPGHRANIMNKNFVHIGVGNLQNSAGTQYWVQLFTY